MFKNYFIESKLLEDLPMLCVQTKEAIKNVSPCPSPTPGLDSEVVSDR